MKSLVFIWKADLKNDSSSNRKTGKKYPTILSDSEKRYAVTLLLGVVDLCVLLWAIAPHYLELVFGWRLGLFIDGSDDSLIVAR